MRTPKGVAAARGTNYSVSVNGVTVLVTVSAGQVTLTIPNFPTPIAMSPGQATSGTNATAVTLASVLSGDPAIAAIARSAMQATASAVATLAADPTSGVTADTLSQVVTTAGEASQATGDTTLVTQVAAAAAAANPSLATEVVTAAVRANPASANSVVASVTDSATKAEATTTTTTGTTTTTTATRPTAAAVAAKATALAAAANTAASSVGSTTTVNAATISTTVQSSQAASTPAAPSTTVTVTQPTTTQPTTTETPVVVDVPTDNTVVTLFSTFTIRLSGGRLVAVTVNNQNAAATVRVVQSVEGTQTTQTGVAGTTVAFTVPAAVTTVVGPISAAQLANIASGIRTALPGPVITVPNNTITLSPSS